MYLLYSVPIQRVPNSGIYVDWGYVITIMPTWAAWYNRELPWIAYLINLKATVNATLRTILQNKNPNERRKVKPGSDFSFSHIFSGLPSSMDVVGEAKQIIFVYNA